MIRCWTFIFVVAAVITERGLGGDGDRSKSPLDPALPYQAMKCNTVAYDVEFSVTVTAPYHTKLLRVWLPVPQNDAGQEIKEGEYDTFPVSVSPRIDTERVYGNKFAYFEFHHPEGAQIIRHRFKTTVDRKSDV